MSSIKPVVTTDHEHEHGPDCQHDHSNDHDHAHHEPQVPFQRMTPKLGRNDPCHCGSGKKFKKCHGVTEMGSAN
jgi:uncharacterized protein YecA (UPF0149 family)